MRTMARSSSNRNSASARASSVLPTPVGPEEQERADRPVRVAEARARAPDGVGDGLDRLVLADDALVQPLLERDQLLRSRPRAGARRGCPSSGDDLGDVLGVDLLVEQALAAVRLERASARPRARAASSGSAPVAQLGGALQVAVALGALGLLAASSICALRVAGSRRSRAFSACQRAVSAASSARTACELAARARPGAPPRPASVSLARAPRRSISSCWTRRSSSSSSCGTESISMRSRLAASSIRSIALSGRKRSAM